ncbi:transglutaminase [Actinoplanes utahensis]|uniref:Transglutaminase n=1 Tax=Actinoplanes utahensis TaxID=1869 RepID=A0A0A6UIB8_ACTUT|nr:transglutaminase [Actinoplanes utahensis]
MRRAVVPVALAGTLILAGAVLGRIFADDLLFRLVAGAALGSVGVGVAARRLPSWTVAPISTVLLAGYTALALHLAAGGAGLTADVARDALTNGIPRLLTAMIPVEAAPDTIVIAVAATWVAGLAATEIAVRGGRVLFGLLPPVLVYGGALYVVGPNASAVAGYTLAFAALAVAALTVSSGAGASTHAAVRVRALGGAAVSLVVLLGLIAAAGPWVGDHVTATPVDPRRYVQPPRVDSLDESPLNRISGWALDPRQRLLEYRPGDPGVPAAVPSASARPGVKPPAPRTVRLRLAVLSDYDGVTWRVGGTYRNAGRVLPPAEVPSGATVSETQHQITITGLTGRLLPAVPTPTRITGVRVAYDAVSGTLIRPESLQTGLRYTAISQVQAPDLNLLPIADVPSGDAVARYLSPGADPPEQIKKLADHLAEDTGAPYERAVAIQDFLAEHYRQVADAPSGHAYPNLGHFLFGRRDLGGQKGTSEQFAAAFAVLARINGLPSRVVVGFVAPAAGGVVTAGDALAWPEVYFDDLGWVAFNPLPKSDQVRPVEQDFTPPPPTPTPSRSDPPTAAPAGSSEPPAAVAAPPAATGPSTVLIASGTSGTVLVLLVAAAAAVAGLRGAQRRRRLTTGDPAQRITGAWLEFTDTLRLAGRPVPAHLSATEAAGHAAVLPPPAKRTGLLRRAVPPPSPPDSDGADAVGPGSVGPASSGEPLPALDALVDAVNTAGFAPEAADAGQAERAGAQVVAYATAVRARRSWWKRIWWSVRPGPLRWNRGQVRRGRRG